MFADSALLESLESDSEPDTPVGDDSDEEGNEDAFENVSEQLHGATSDIVPLDVSNIYEMPQFFSAVYEEQCPDSVGVSSGSQTVFYNPEKGELHKNMVFRSKKELIAAVKDFSVRCVRREYRVVESTPTLWKVRCKNRSSSMDCGWGLRACLKANLGYFKITKYGDRHTCVSSHVGIDHKNLDKNMIASNLIGIVHCDPSCEIKFVQQLIKDKYGYEISYAKAWYSLKRAVENVYGTWESSVRILPTYMGALMKFNPGTIVEWRHFPTNNPSIKVLNYVFWAFRPCVDGFRYCRKIISIDGTHLYTKYKHKMLIAAGLDANNQILPLAFALVDEESYDSWKWFLDLLCVHVINGLPGVCIISDRHRAIIGAVEGIPQFNPPYGVHRFCLRHVCSNFNTHFKNVHLKDLCWQAGSQHQVRKFDDIMNEIKNKQPNAYKYLSEIDKHKWTLAHDGGWRFGMMTTNISECLNGVLKGARRLPITAIVKMTFQRCAEYFINRITKCQRMMQNNQPWPDYVLHKYEKWSVRSNEHSVSRIEIRAKQATVTTGILRHLCSHGSGLANT
ncbi:uncharacterized protein [Primulina eburnea]|uniref:uncharacterized protein n=1 Tax=Primulina eburnea TaxID=1245227 RepID=UPI003C6C8963